MADSHISIASNALIRLAGDPISSFDDGSSPTGNKHGQIAGNLWPSIRDAALRSHPWNCAIKRVVLAPLTETPVFGYSNQFALPGDWLRTLDINDVPSDEAEFRMESRKILVNSTQVRLRYVFRNEDVATWDAMLSSAAELMMAVAMCYPVTLSTSLRTELRSELEFLLKQARAIDGQEESQQTFGDFPILNSRFTGSSNNFDSWRGE